MRMVDKKNIFTNVVRGFHFYRANWNPKEVEFLNCFHEAKKQYDIFSIKVCKSVSKIIGHPLMEVSWITKFIIHRDAIVTVKVTRENYRWRSLVQGCLEVLCEISVRTSGSIYRFFTELQGIPKKKETFFEHLPQERALNISSKNSIWSKPYNLWTRQKRKGSWKCFYLILKLMP